MTDRHDPDCGCLERETDNSSVGFIAIHLLPSRVAEIFVDDGENEFEFEVRDCDSLDDAQRKAEKHTQELYEQEKCGGCEEMFHDDDLTYHEKSDQRLCESCLDDEIYGTANEQAARDYRDSVL